MNFFVLGLFVVSAVALLGSPGPGIASLIAVGRAEGFAGGLRYFGGLQVGLAIAAAVSAAGLFSLVRMVPGATAVMRVAAMLYLLWLAWQIASAPVGEKRGKAASPRPSRPGCSWGFLTRRLSWRLSPCSPRRRSLQGTGRSTRS